MKIGLVTNWGERCSIAEYARNLTDHCLKVSKDVEFKIVTKPLQFGPVWEQTRDCDIVHFSYCAHAFADMDPNGWVKFTGQGQPIIWTLHESTDWWVRKLVKTKFMDYLVVHDRARDSAPFADNVRVIPFGVLDVDVSKVQLRFGTVGTFGAAYPWKGLYPLAYACGRLGLELVALLSEPDTDRGKIDWSKIVEELGQVCPKLKVVKEWLPQEEVVRRLAECLVLAFPFDYRSPITGISSSVRFGLAARRPLVLTRFAHFSDLYDDHHDIYFVEHGQLVEKLQEAVDETMGGFGRFPRMARTRMLWERAAHMYCSLYAEALAGVSVGQGTVAG